MKRKWKEKERKDEVTVSKSKKKTRMEERIANQKPRSVLTKEKKYTSLHLREAVGKNRLKNKTGE